MATDKISDEDRAKIDRAVEMTMGALESIHECWEGVVSGIVLPEDVQYSTLLKLEGALAGLSLVTGSFRKYARRFQTKYNEVLINRYILENEENDEQDYDLKKKRVAHWNEFLRNADQAIAHPETGEPCLLIAVGSRDGFGRYVLENRTTKKRSHASKTLKEMLPLRLTDAPKRKEGVIERRKKNDSKD